MICFIEKLKIYSLDDILRICNQNKDSTSITSIDNQRISLSLFINNCKYIYSVDYIGNYFFQN